MVSLRLKGKGEEAEKGTVVSESEFNRILEEVAR